SPAGEQVTLTDLPLNILPTPDGTHALVATSGYNAHELSLIDLETKRRVASEAVRQSWVGLAADEGVGRGWWSGGGGDLTHEFRLEGNRLERVGDREPKGDEASKKGKGHFRSGLALDRKNATLYMLDVDAGTITAQQLEGDKAARTARVGNRPYDVA